MTSSDSPVGTVVVVVDDVSARRLAGIEAARSVFGPESTGAEQAATPRSGHDQRHAATAAAAS